MFTRFITSGYKDLFTVQDGEKILVTETKSGEQVFECAIKNIDETHFWLNNRVFHICEFAEYLETNGCQVQKVGV